MKTDRNLWNKAKQFADKHGIRRKAVYEYITQFGAEAIEDPILLAIFDLPEDELEAFVRRVEERVAKRTH